jgi:DnaK suppressor protein
MKSSEFMTSAQLAKILNDKQSQLLTRIHAIEQDLQQGRSQDFAEQTTESENDQVLDEIYLEAKQELLQVNLALSKLAQGSYGICSKCAEPIAVERLHVLPYASTCINCAD